MDYTQNIQVTMTDRIKMNSDSYMFRFEFQNQENQLSLKATQHIIIFGQNMKGQYVPRKYTPIEGGKGFFLIPIKIYRPNVNPKFPEGGELTPWLEQVPLNTKITIKICVGKVLYNEGEFILKPKFNKTIRQFKNILMVCGGSGITPAYQLIRNICDNQKDNTNMTLLYCNRKEEDIWLREELDLLKQSKKLSIYYTLDQPPDYWNGLKGHVNLEMLLTIFPHQENTLGIVCGPKGMNKLMFTLFQQMGMMDDNYLKF